MLAEFASRMRPSITIPASQHVRALEGIVTRRRQLLEMQTMERNRLGSTRDESARVSAEMLELIRADSELKCDCAGW